MGGMENLWVGFKSCSCYGVLWYGHHICGSLCFQFDFFSFSFNPKRTFG